VRARDDRSLSARHGLAPHDFVAGREERAELFDASGRVWIERLLKIGVERTRAQSAALHGTQTPVMRASPIKPNMTGGASGGRKAGLALVARPFKLKVTSDGIRIARMFFRLKDFLCIATNRPVSRRWLR